MLDEMEAGEYEYPPHFTKFIEATKQYPSSSTTFLSVILDVNHAFSFIKTDEWTEASLVGRCYSKSLLLLKTTLCSICNHECNLRSKIDD